MNSRNIFDTFVDKASNFFQGAYKTFSNVSTSVVNTIGKVPDVVQSLGNNAINTVGGIGQTIAFIPLIAVGLAGVALIFLFKNASPTTISDVSRNVAGSASTIAPLAL